MKHFPVLFMARDENAIKELSLKYYPYCYKIAWNLLANKGDSEESRETSELTTYGKGLQVSGRMYIWQRFLGKWSS